MGRPSKLTDAQWERIGKRLLAGESNAALAREFNISKANISGRFSKRTETVKNVANQIVATDRAISFLNVSEQIAAFSLADELKAISMHMAGAGKFGAATSHRLAMLANAQVSKIDETDPMESQEILQGISALTKMSNDASMIPINLLNSQREMIRDLNAVGNKTNAELLKELVASLPL